MIVKTCQAFTLRDTSTGELAAFAFGTVYTVDSTTGAALIAAGLAEEYENIVPSGAKAISANGTYDVTSYASAVVNCTVVTVSYDANGGTGTIANASVVSGDSVTLNNGATLTPPEGKEFAGWGTTDSKTEPDAVSPLTVTESVTLYAVWVDAT